MTLYESIANHQEDLISTLQECIRIPSVYAEDDSGYPYGLENHRCLEYVLEKASAMGFSTHNMDDRVGWCEYGEGEEMVVVLGHLDVVPAGVGWDDSPFSGAVKDGRIYGRGAADDKGPMIAALYALLALKECGVTTKRRIRLLFGCDEERGGSDMAYYNAHGGEIPVMGITPDADYPLINGEKGLLTESYTKAMAQTGSIRLMSIQGGAAHNIVPDKAVAQLACSAEQAKAIAAMRGEKVQCTPTDTGITIEAFGTNAHGSMPWQGENAIGRLLLFLDKLPLEGDLKDAVHLLAEKLGMEWDGKSLGIDLHDDVSGPLTFNLGVIRGDEATITIDVNYRYPVTKSFDQCAPQCKAQMESGGFIQSKHMHNHALYKAPDSPLVQMLMQIYKDYTGDLEAQPKSIGGGTYAKAIPNTIAFGAAFPDDEDCIHKPNEYVKIDRLMDNTRILANAMCALANN